MASADIFVWQSITNRIAEPSVGAMIVFDYREITERKRAQEELRWLNAELEQRVA